MKYKYTRKEFLKKYVNDMPYHLRAELLATVDKPEEEVKNIRVFSSNEEHMREAHSKPDKEFKSVVCGCSKIITNPDACKTCSVLNPTPSPLDEIEEIEEIIRPVSELKEKCLGKILSVEGKINSLIRNQNLIIKELKQK